MRARRWRAMAGAQRAAPRARAPHTLKDDAQAPRACAAARYSAILPACRYAEPLCATLADAPCHPRLSPAIDAAVLPPATFCRGDILMSMPPPHVLLLKIFSDAAIQRAAYGVAAYADAPCRCRCRYVLLPSCGVCRQVCVGVGGVCRGVCRAG